MSLVWFKARSRKNIYFYTLSNHMLTWLQLYLTTIKATTKKLTTTIYLCPVVERRGGIENTDLSPIRPSFLKSWKISEAPTSLLACGYVLSWVGSFWNLVHWVKIQNGCHHICKPVTSVIVFILLKHIVSTNDWGVQSLIGGHGHHWPPSFFSLVPPGFITLCKLSKIKSYLCSPPCNSCPLEHISWKTFRFTSVHVQLSPVIQDRM